MKKNYSKVNFDEKLDTLFVKVPDYIDRYPNNTWIAIIGNPPHQKVISGTHIVKNKNVNPNNMEVIKKLAKLQEKEE
ncbi:MAG: hypothetical protein ACOCP8_02065 [archaeon]